MTRLRMETEKGAIVIEMFDDDAPETVKNFVGLATGEKAWTDPATGQKVKRPYYDGLRFHRVVPDFVVQSGDPLTRDPGLKHHWGAGGPGYFIRDELSGKRQMHERGSVSMAHRGPNTAGSQFFVCQARQAQFDGKHTIFGRVAEGMDVVDRIAEGDEILRVTLEG